HDSKLAGHFGQHKTLELIRRNFYWPKMEEMVEHYVSTCDNCQRNKTTRHKRFGLLHPLETPYAPWDSISMDFIVQLPQSAGHTQIWVVVDRFTKMARFIALPTKCKAPDLAKLFLKEIFRFHGLPLDIVSDRDSRFTSNFWKELMDLLEIKRNMSTAFHPQSDGQTERVNQTLEAYLRAFANYEQSNWSSLLHVAEFAYNNSESSATKMTPFYANFGFHPRSSWPTDKGSRNPYSQQLVHWMSAVTEKCREHLGLARDKMGKYY